MLLGKRTIKTLISDRGYKGKRKVHETIIEIPTPFSNKKQSRYQQIKLKKQFRRRAAIEPINGHLKSDHRLERNFYKGITGVNIHVMLAATAFNFKRMMNKWESSFLSFFKSWLQGFVQIIIELELKYYILKMSF
jgi:IS5 family transposase